MEAYIILGLGIGIILLSLSLIRLKKQIISQSTFALWFILGIIIIIISVVPSIIFSIQEILGTEYTLSGILGLAISFLVIVVFYLHQRIDTLNDKITKLIAELGSKDFNNK